MKSRRGVFVLLFTALLPASAPAAQPSAEALGIIPLPRTIMTTDGTYPVPPQWTIYGNSASELTAADFALSYFRTRGATVYIVKNPEAALRFSIVKDAALPNEAYRVIVSGSGVEISATSAAGLFYGLQTFEQIADTSGTNLPFLEIVDSPRFAWRGIHLDVSRHFFPVPVVERYIDVAAHYKLNTFHWHLTDDQGWRIEIKHYPLLTKVGSCRAQTQVGNDATEFDGKKYCGYYTQDQIREVVEYARKRYVTIVPEIEMPGHADASVAAYPSLACGAPHVKVRQTWGISHDIYCPTEPTFHFLSVVLEEVASLFPGRYIHAGGDEVPKDEWQHSNVVHQLMRREKLRTYDDVQGYFDRRIESILSRYGKRMIGWDEMLDGGVSRSTTIMAWHSVERGIKAASRGYDVVMTPDGPLYFDAYQGDQNDEPLAIGGLSRPQDVYALEPARNVSFTIAKHIVGVQANLWTEYIGDPSYLFYMVLPRELALSELAWSAPERRDWVSFEKRMTPQYAWLTRDQLNFRIPNPLFAVTSAGATLFSNVNPSMRTVEMRVTGGDVSVAMETPVAEATIHYTMDGSTPTAKSRLYSAPLKTTIREGTKIDITAVTILRDGRTSTPSEIIVHR